MATTPNRLSQFWQELKRRNVVRVVTVYTATAFVIIELINNITEPLQLPEWTPTLVIVLLALGFPIAVIFSWIYDVHPEGGMVKTEPAGKLTTEDISKSSNSWKVASYISFVVIVGLIVLNVFGVKRGARIDDSQAKSIAVLPFLNLSGDPGQEYVCTGLTDEIISHLFKVEAFDKVASMTSVRNFKNSEMSTTQIAEELKVNYILEGSAKKMGDELKITAQLIEAKYDKHIWLHDYNLPYEGIVGIPGEIAIQIVDHLKVFITKSETEHIHKIPTTNQEAYDLLQQAQHLLASLENLAWERLIGLTLKAIELDPEYADAYAMAGFYYLNSGIYYSDKEMQSVQWNALSYFEKALEIDPDNFWANYGMALYNEWIRWDYIKAEANYIEILRLFPNNTDAMGVLTHVIEFYTKRDRPDDLNKYLNRLEYKEGFGEYQYREIKALLLSNDSAASEKLIKSYVESWNELAYKYAGELYIWIGNFIAAKDYLEAAVRAEDWQMGTPRFQSCLALAYQQTGNPDKAQPIIRELIERSDTTSSGSPDFFTGWYYSLTGKADSAFLWLEKAFQNRSAEMPWLKVDPAFRNLKNDLRYWDLYKRTGHKAYDDYLVSETK